MSLSDLASLTLIAYFNSAAREFRTVERLDGLVSIRLVRKLNDGETAGAPPAHFAAVHMRHAIIGEQVLEGVWGKGNGSGLRFSGGLAGQDVCA